MRAVWLVAFVAGCLADPRVPCGALSCPSGDVCTTGGRCATPADASACAGKSDGDTCTTTAIGNGACGGGACHEIVCGDHVVDPGEACDDGNTIPGDGCSATCDSTEICGNLVVDLIDGEECDTSIPKLSSKGCSSTCKLETVAWRDATPQPIAARVDTAMAYDAKRGRIVLFGGDAISALGDTWEWDGTQWQIRIPITSPPARSLALMVYDDARGTVIMFGGAGGSGELSDLWEWDGTTWTGGHPLTSPQWRGYSAMVYDIARDRIVLFGGIGTGIDDLDDTWEWDGTTWTQMQPATSPPARYGHAMGYDASRSRVVLYGGWMDSTNSYPQDTWEYDGTTWTERTATTTTPPGEYLDPMFYDSNHGHVVMYDSWDGTAMWQWSGLDWSQAMAPGPAGRYEPGIAYDVATQRLVVFGGSDATGEALLGDTWQWSGTAWTQSSTAAASPTPRQSPAAVYDNAHGNIVLFGGVRGGYGAFGDTWIFTREGWTQRFPATSPPVRGGFAMVFDDASNRVVIFGGDGTTDPSILYADTWEWDGTTWTERTPAQAPSKRTDHAMAYDAARGRVVLFGGFDGNGALGDTWEWDGTSWTQLAPAIAPSAREDHAMAYDPVRQRVVLFGGYNDDGSLGDTWEWDGQTWTQLAPASSPVARSGHGMVYDPQRQRVVLFGGSQFGLFSDTWEWDGTQWSQVLSSLAGPERLYAAITYDAIQHALVVFGGSGAADVLADTWMLQYGSSSPTERCLSATADEDGDGLAGCDDPDCWARCRPLCPPGTPCDPARPRCGDGICAPIEDASICPADCP